MTTHLLADRWAALQQLLTRAVLDLAADGRLEVLLPDTRLALTWLTPDLLLLSLHSDRAVDLAASGWTGSAGTWHRTERGREPAAGRAAVEALTVVRTVLRAGPDDVELRAPRAAGQNGLW